MKSNLSIKSLLFLCFLHSGYVLASEPSYWSRFKAAVSSGWQREKHLFDVHPAAAIKVGNDFKKVVTLATLYGGMAGGFKGAAGVITGSAGALSSIWAISGIMKSVYGIGEGDIVSSIVGGVMLSSGSIASLLFFKDLGGQEISSNELKVAMGVGAGAALIGLTSAGCQKIYAYYQERKITKQQTIALQKEVIIKSYAVSDALLPTIQMRLNCLGMTMIALKKEASDEAMSQLTALETYKKELESSDVFQNTKSIESMSTIEKLWELYNNPTEKIPLSVSREAIINRYISGFVLSHAHKAATKGDISYEDEALWKLIKDEISTEYNKKSFDVYSLGQPTFYKYIAFKAFLKNINLDKMLPVIWYEHEYETIKVKNNSKALSSWLIDVQSDSFYQKEWVDNARINVEKKLAYKELENRTNEDKIRIYSTRMQAMSPDTVEYKVYQEIIKELNQIP